MNNHGSLIMNSAVHTPSQAAGESAAPEVQQAGLKRKRDEAFQMGDDTCARQAAWVSGASTSASWRPSKLHRVSAKHWLMQVDKQLRSSTHFDGLSYFQLSASDGLSPFVWAVGCCGRGRKCRGRHVPWTAPEAEDRVHERGRKVRAVKLGLLRLGRIRRTRRLGRSCRVLCWEGPEAMGPNLAGEVLLRLLEQLVEGLRRCAAGSVSCWQEATPGTRQD